MDINLAIQSVSTTIQLLATLITLISVILIYKTMKTHQKLNQRTLFNEVVKQERELRIKLLEYRNKINKIGIKKKEKEETKLDYDTLLFNYYEFLAICLHRRLINEIEAKLFFKESLISVKELFESSLLFKEEYAKKEQYKGLQWLFKKWNI